MYSLTSRILLQRCFSTLPRSLKKISIQNVMINHETGVKRYVHLSTIDLKRRKTKEEKKADKLIQYTPKKTNDKKSKDAVDVWRNITVQELADQIGKPIEHIQEVMLYVKNVTDFEAHTRIEDMKVLKEIIEKCGQKMRIIGAPVHEHMDDVERDVKPRPPAPEANLLPRSPVVTVMGHVDHGKTTLLDTLRGTSVAAGEAGGITQHIGAFTVALENGEEVTFLDTPGHAAFSAMRARGAHVTDIIVLVVAADDGVMEQTKEVIRLAQSEQVPIIVAINKIDKPEANIERTLKGLAQMGIALEGHGGDTQYVGISALKGTNLKQLVEAISTQATLMSLKAEHVGPVEGVVIESNLDSRRGKLSTAIVTRGTLRKGAILLSGLAHAKVRSMFDHNGKVIEETPPGKPVEILGWRELPSSGDLILEVDSEKTAHAILKWRQHKSLEDRALSDLEAIRAKQNEHDEQYKKDREARLLSGKFKRRTYGIRAKESAPDDLTPRVSVIIKADVHGSLEAILDVLDTYHSNDKCKLDIVHYGVGDVSEGDLELAKVFKAIIYAFSVNLPKSIPKSTTIKEVNIIYRLVDDLKSAINEKLPQIPEDEIIGEANVLQLFKVTDHRKEVTVLGCRCTKGILKKNMKFRVMRQGEMVHEGELISMRHLKNEVDSIKKDVECGLRFEDQTVEILPGDTIVCYQIIMKSQETDWDPGF
uniref:CSON001165 protein n=1 Tax=Culicoides sonorensis TaxID=179676 RepID=A0A336MIR5_CULSO